MEKGPRRSRHTPAAAPHCVPPQVTAGIGVFEALRQLGSHEVAPRDDSGLRPTVMQQWRDQQQRQQQRRQQQQQQQQQRVQV